MCDFVRASAVDLDEAYRCGVEAVKLAEKGESGYMVSIKRTSNNPYTIELGKVPLKEVAVSAKPMSHDFSTVKGIMYLKNSSITLNRLQENFLNLFSLKKYLLKKNKIINHG